MLRPRVELLAKLEHSSQQDPESSQSTANPHDSDHMRPHSSVPTSNANFPTVIQVIAPASHRAAALARV